MVNTEYSDYIAEQRRELERVKIQFRDERNAWQRQNYTAARVEQKLDYLEDVIRQNGERKFENHEVCTIDDNHGTMTVCLSDLHIGANYNSVWGMYNTDIAKRRLDEYFDNVVKIGNRHSIDKVVVLGLGDLINGSIHKTIAITNRENVIDQIMIASELISNFIYKLTQKFGSVKFINVAGNHSRIDKKDDALKDERLDDLIGWYVSHSLSHIENFVCIKNVDNTLSSITIEGNIYYLCHGDYDSFNKQGVANIVMAMGVKPTGVFFGHCHTSAMEDVSDIKLIRSGCLGGSGDDYTIEKRLTGKPSQMVAICNSDGVECVYPITLH